MSLVVAHCCPEPVRRHIQSWRKLTLLPASVGQSSETCLTFLALAKHGFGDAEAIDADRYAAVDRDLREHRADLVGGQSVAQRAANMGCELLHLPQRRNHAEIEN